jgi:hypothetical protein
MAKFVFSNIRFFLVRPAPHDFDGKGKSYRLGERGREHNKTPIPRTGRASIGNISIALLLTIARE